MVELHDNWEMFNENETQYSKIEDRMWKHSDKKFKQFMGQEFINPPLPTKEDLEERVERISRTLKRYKELKTPDIIFSSEQSSLEKTLMELNEGKFQLTQSDKNYAKEYYDKADKYVPEILSWVDFDYERIFVKYYGD